MADQESGFGEPAIEVTYDRDARTLYLYFADIAQGEDATQMEVDGRWLLDKQGQIIGVGLALGDLQPVALRFATRLGQVERDDDGGMRIWFRRETPATEEPLPFEAIVDLDRAGTALGVEVQAEPEWEIGDRLQYAEPFIVEVFDGDDVDWDAEDERPVPPPAASAPQSDVDQEPQAAPAADLLEAQPPVAQADSPEEVVRCGFVALLGRPNVGKSTIMNAYLGQKVSIVSPKPQTTRIPVRGILNSPDAQIIFVDTPGLHTPKSGLGEYMVQAARRAIPDSDVLCFVVDASEPPGALDKRIALQIQRSHKPTILVLNKVDIARKADVFLQQYRELGPWTQEVAISAKTTDGLAGLLEEITTLLPEGPRLFPPDQLTDLSEREQVAELIREKVLLNTSEEVPHGVAVEIDEWEQRGPRLYIRATINVEREGHKGIVIGDGGQMLKKIGATARYEIERALKQPVYLDLWVKVRKDWRRDPSSLRWLGYDVGRLKK